MTYPWAYGGAYLFSDDHERPLNEARRADVSRQNKPGLPRISFSRSLSTLR